MKWAAFVLGLSAVWLGGCASDSPPFAPGSRAPDDDDAGDATDGARTAELRVLHAGSALPPVDVWVGSEKDGGKAITGTAYGELSEWTTIGFADATTPVEVIESASGTSLGKAEYYESVAGMELVGVVVGDDPLDRAQPFGLTPFPDAVPDGAPDDVLILCVVNGSRVAGDIGIEIVGQTAVDLNPFVDPAALAFATPACFGVRAGAAFEVGVDRGGDASDPEHRFAVPATYPAGSVLLAVFLTEEGAPTCLLHHHGTDTVVALDVAPI